MPCVKRQSFTVAKSNEMFEGGHNNIYMSFLHFYMSYYVVVIPLMLLVALLRRFSSVTGMKKIDIFIYISIIKSRENVYLKC